MWSEEFTVREQWNSGPMPSLVLVFVGRSHEKTASAYTEQFKRASGTGWAYFVIVHLVMLSPPRESENSVMTYPAFVIPARSHISEYYQPYKSHRP